MQMLLKLLAAACRMFCWERGLFLCP